MTSFLAQVLYSVWTARTMVPVRPLLPSEVSEILLTLCDHRPIHDPAPCCSSVTEQRGPRCRASSSRTHTHVIRLWLPGNSFILVWLNLWFWKKKKQNSLGHPTSSNHHPVLSSSLLGSSSLHAPLKDPACRHTSQLSHSHQWHHCCSFLGPSVMISPFFLAYN